MSLDTTYAKTCLRCGQWVGLSPIGAALFNFVCDGCRLDNNPLHKGHDLTIKDMTYQLTTTFKGAL